MFYKSRLPWDRDKKRKMCEDVTVTLYSAYGNDAPHFEFGTMVVCVVEYIMVSILYVTLPTESVPGNILISNHSNSHLCGA